MSEVLELFKDTKEILNSSFPNNLELLTKITCATPETTLAKSDKSATAGNGMEVRII